MPTINPYLNFPENTEEAFNFYKTVFGGEFLGGVIRFGDSPETDEVSEDEKDKVMNIALPIGDGNVLMATDALESMGQEVHPGNNFYISIQADSKEEADRLFEGLSAGGEIELEMHNAFWGDYFGMFRDQFSIRWMISYSEKS